MPKIFEYFGFIFFFYSNEHTPIHVHVIKGDRETVFELIIKNANLIEVRKRTNENHNPLSAKEIDTAQKFIEKYSKNIIEKWIKFFVYGQQIRSTNITKKI